MKTCSLCMPHFDFSKASVVPQVFTTSSKECLHFLETWMPGDPLKGQQQMALVSACKGTDNICWPC